MPLHTTEQIQPVEIKVSFLGKLLERSKYCCPEFLKTKTAVPTFQECLENTVRDLFKANNFTAISPLSPLNIVPVSRTWLYLLTFSTVMCGGQERWELQFQNLNFPGGDK